jgi:hypothetical protein
MERVAWSIAEWGKLYGFGRTKTYGIIKRGLGPKLTRIHEDGPAIVTIEADTEWRRSLPEIKLEDLTRQTERAA